MATLTQTMAPVAALLLSTAVLLAGNGLQTTLLPLRAHLDGFTAAELGILGSAYFVGFTLGCLTGARVIARAGHIRAFLALVSVASAAALVHALTPEPGIWWALRAIAGFCLSVLFIVIESWLNERADNATRGGVFSVYMIINLCVGALGPVMVVLGDPRSFPLFALASILFSLAAVPVAMTRSQSPAPVPFIVPRLARFYAVTPVGFIGSLAVGLANGAVVALGPLFALRNGLDTAGAGLFVAATLIGGAAGQWPLGWISDRLDRRLVIMGASLAAAPAGLALGFLNLGEPALILALAFVFGMCAYPLYSICVGHANDHAAPTDFVETSGALLLVYGLGAIAGPVAAALLMAQAGAAMLFVYTAGVHVFVAAFVWWRVTRRAPVAPDDKVEFREAIVAAQTVTALDMVPDPRAAHAPPR